MEQQDSLLVKQLAVERLSPLVMGIILVLQGQDEAGIEQDGSRRHG
jgi:hypothetical protein